MSNLSNNIPSPGCAPDLALDTAILLFYADLNAAPPAPAGSGTYTATLGSAPNRQFVVEWRTTLFGFETSSRLNGEIVFYENSPTISLIYGPGSDAGADEVSGIQLGTGSRFVQFSCATPTLVPGLRVDYIPGTVVTGPGAGGGPHVKKSSTGPPGHRV